MSEQEQSKEKEKEKEKQDLKNELIIVLKELQSEIQICKAKEICEFSKKMEGQLKGTSLTDNPKFNEFIKKFSNDPKNLNNEDAEKISNKLMMAFLYINTV